MDSTTSHRPWQVGPVSPTGRIAAAALVALATDSLFVWQAAPHVLESLAVTSIPVLVAIRVIRGFPRSLELAAMTFAVVALVAAAAVAGIGQSHGPQVTAALTVAALLAAAGLVATALDWLKIRRSPVVVMRNVHETHDFLRRKPWSG